MNLDKFTQNGKFLMLALDHRGSFKKLINPHDPDSISDNTVIQLKSEIIQALADKFSGILIDEVWGLEACKEVCQVKPFLLPLEKSSHTGLTELEYTALDLKNLGASGAKILIDFDPNSENVEHQLETSKKVMDDCKANNFPLFLEIVTRTNTSEVSSQASTEFHLGGGALVIESLKMFLDFGIKPDVWKLEYPGSLEACQKITVMVGETPWILLTGGQSFEEFRLHLETAIEGGTKGFLAGRALWQEVCTMDGEEKQKFLKETLPERFREISEIATSFHSSQ